MQSARLRHSQARYTGFASISDDRRVQIILLGFFLRTFLKGVADFGTPVTVGHLQPLSAVEEVIASEMYAHHQPAPTHRFT